jgi:hypothetical protein
MDLTMMAHQQQHLAKEENQRIVLAWIMGIIPIQVRSI